MNYPIDLAYVQWTVRRLAPGLALGWILFAAAASGQSTYPAAMSGANTMGIFRPTIYGLTSWVVDSTGDHQWESADNVFWFGANGDIPVMGDWDNSGKLKMGIFRNGYWYVDWNDNHGWDAEDAQHIFAFGVPGDYPIIGDWDHTGRLRLGVFRPSDGAVYADMS